MAKKATEYTLVGGELYAPGQQIPGPDGSEDKEPETPDTTDADESEDKEPETPDTTTGSKPRRRSR